MYDLHDARARDAQHASERALGNAGVGGDHHQRGEALRRDVERSERRLEVLVDGDLRTPERIADEAVEHAVRDAGHATLEALGWRGDAGHARDASGSGRALRRRHPR
jgi:methylmalonyl-CoA mutase cobalamin-binding subunit